MRIPRGKIDFHFLTDQLSQFLDITLLNNFKQYSSTMKMMRYEVDMGDKELNLL